MARSLRGANSGEASGEIDQIAIDYKLKLIAFQDELFQSRKKLQDSDRKMAELQNKLEEYVQNKENQIAEVLFTAHMNVQRIETQTRSHTDYVLLEMEEEMQRKQKELDVLQKKTSNFAAEIQPDTGADMDNQARLQIVQDNIRAFREQIETNEIIDVSPENKKPAKTTKKPAALSEEKEQATKSKKVDKPAEKQELTPPEPIIEEVAKEEPAAPVKKADKTLTGKKRLIVAKKSDKARMEKKQGMADNTGDTSLPTDSDTIAVQEQKNTEKVQTPSKDLAGPDFDAREILGTIQAEPAEPNEMMRLDAFVDARYYNEEKQIKHCALQVTIEVDIPPDNYSVRYSKVSSDVVSNLMHYDNVVLNDVFPFNIIEPNPQNIAMYFYNSLEDMLSLMDLGLHSLTLLELPDLQIKVNTRNKKLDSFLHQEEDILGNIRNSLIPCVESEQEDNTSIKGTLNKILKKRN